MEDISSSKEMANNGKFYWYDDTSSNPSASTIASNSSIDFVSARTPQKKHNKIIPEKTKTFCLHGNNREEIKFELIENKIMRMFKSTQGTEEKPRRS